MKFVRDARNGLIWDVGRKFQAGSSICPKSKKKKAPERAFVSVFVMSTGNRVHMAAATKLLHGHFLIEQCHHDSDHLLFMGCLVIFH